MRYEGDFASREDICREFAIGDFDGTVLFANYSNEGYDGYANVLFMDGTKLYYVEGSHCSCHGLETQWSPEEMSVEQIVHMAEHGNGFFSKNSWIADALRRIWDQELAKEPDEILMMLALLA